MSQDAILIGLHPDDAEVVRSLPLRLHEANGVPDPAMANARRRAADEVRRVLGADLGHGGLRVSPLGAAWSKDLDCHVRRLPDRARLESAGWIELSGLLAHLGFPGCTSWAVVSDGEVVGSADLHVTPAGDEVERILARCRQQRVVRLREVLELRAIRREGGPFPDRSPVLEIAAGIEASLPGERLLAPWYDGCSRVAPVSAPELRPIMHRARRPVAVARSFLRRRVQVVVCGADDAATAELAQAFVEAMSRVGIPHTHVQAGVGSDGDVRRSSTRGWSRLVDLWYRYVAARGVVVVPWRSPRSGTGVAVSVRSGWGSGPNASIVSALSGLVAAGAREVIHEPS